MNEKDILQSVVAGAMIVVSGGAYALLLALGRIRQARVLRAGAWAAYGVLVVFTLLLVDGLRLGGAWLIVVAVMLLGYFFAPGAIWHLTTATHRAAHGQGASGRSVGS